MKTIPDAMRDPRTDFFHKLNQSTAQPPSAPVDISAPLAPFNDWVNKQTGSCPVCGGAHFYSEHSAMTPPPQHAAPIYDTCEFCRLPVRPGESHGVVAQDADGNPKLVCKIQRLQMVEEVVEAHLPGSALAPR